MGLHEEPLYNTVWVRYIDRGSPDRMGYHSFKVEGYVQYIGNSSEIPIIPRGYSPINHKITICNGVFDAVDETTFNLLMRGNVGFPICRFYR